MIYLIIFPQIVNFLPMIRQDLKIITNWAFQWKTIFKPDLSKQAQEVIFSRKVKKLLHPTLRLFQKHLGLTLDIKLNF